MTRTHTRAGFTLVEMLVALAIMIGLMGLAVMIVPGARDQDQVRTAVGDVTANLKIAQGMAARDKAPRGIRFLLDPTRTGAEQFYSTEMQYIELPVPLVFNRTPGSPPPGQSGTWTPAQDARVRFAYTVAAYSATPTTPPSGTVTNRQCFIDNVTTTQAGQITTGSTIVMPVFGAWSKIVGVGAQTPGATASLVNQEVTLEVYPDAVMGGSTLAQTNHFAIYAALPGAGGIGTTSGAVPLVGESTIPLPSGACVDLSQGSSTAPYVGSLPGLGSVTPPYFDVIFGSDGKLIGNYGGQIFLWVHGTNKFPNNIQMVPGPPNQSQQEMQLADAYRRAGDQFFLLIRGSGVISRAEVTQPNANGRWNGTTPFDLARQNAQ